VVVTWFCRHLNYFLELARWFSASGTDLVLQTFRFTETRAGNAAPFVPQVKQAVSGQRPEAFLNDKAESLRGGSAQVVPI
jgi:hypothetical protein